jgi:hypothetical protein
MANGMKGSRPNRSGAHPSTGAVLLLATLLAHDPAGADPASPTPPAATPAEARSSGWISLGVLTGSTKPDGTLADYQWDTNPRAAWGAQALAGRGRFATGLRFWRTQTTQDIGLPGATSGPSVRWTSLELVGEGRLATLRGVHVLAMAGAGRMHLDYDPDQITFDPGTGTPVVVDFRPVDEWIFGGGVSMKRPLGGRWTLGLELDRRVFGLEAAHRKGGVIVIGRESFGDWSARLELARLYGRL